MRACGRWRTWLAAWLVAGMVVSCGSRTPRERSTRAPLPVRVVADTGRSERWTLGTPRARIWMDSVRTAPSRPVSRPVPAAPPRRSVPEPALPEATPGSEFGGVENTPAPGDENLRPPLLRTPALLRLPAARTEGDRWVDLDVRVDETGVVTDADWAAGNQDPRLVAAAVECAMAMRFHPALLGDRPVAVWCRQRFEIPAR